LPDFNPDLFKRHGIDVSRETIEKFSRYAALLLKWQKVINLVGESTLDDLATRHFLDSAQLIKHIPNKDIRLVDMGSGAGFPGLVLAMLGMTDVHLVESDVRKATFLREVSRETSTKVTVYDDRVEDTHISGVNIITARALAPLKDLLTMARKISDDNFDCLFLKGEKTEEELATAQKRWNFDVEIFPSVTDSDGKILYINNLKDK
jgi:16S rRNA (guanine527-N7)-methyltransferase